MYLKKVLSTISHVKITRSTSSKLIVPNCRVYARADFFLVKIINVWNRLSDEIINAPVAFQRFMITSYKDLSYSLIIKLYY